MPGAEKTFNKFQKIVFVTSLIRFSFGKQIGCLVNLVQNNLYKMVLCFQCILYLVI